MNKSNFHLRFGFGSKNGHHSGIWRIWASTSPYKSDVYLAPRAMASSLKVSFHESGSWQASFTSEFETKMKDKGEWSRGSRHIEIWKKPENITKDVTLAFRVIIPQSELRNYLIDLPASKEVFWIPESTNGKVAEIAVIFAKPDSIKAEWPGKVNMGTSLMGHHVLPNSDSLWIVYRFDPSLESMVEEQKKVARQGIFAGSPDFFRGNKIKAEVGHRVILSGEGSDKSYFYIEYASDTILGNRKLLR